MPRRDFLLDDLGNRVLVAGDYGFAEGSRAVVQGVQCRVRLWSKEVWTDQSLGVDYAGKVLIANPSVPIIKAEIASAIASTPDVSRVANIGFTRDPKTRAATVSYTAASTDGPIASMVNLDA